MSNFGNNKDHSRTLAPSTRLLRKTQSKIIHMTIEGPRGSGELDGWLGGAVMHSREGPMGSGAGDGCCGRAQRPVDRWI